MLLDTATDFKMGIVKITYNPDFVGRYIQLSSKQVILYHD